MQFSESKELNSRGQSLYAVSYFPARDGTPWPPKAVLLWHHGYGEHISRKKYVNFFTQLASAGIAVVSYDAHGHGKSEPAQVPSEKCLVNSWHHLVDDCVHFANSMIAKYGATVPAFIGGASLGGLIATHTVLRDQSAWSGLILSAAAIDVEWTPVLRMQALIGGLLAALVPRARIVPAVELQNISPDADVIEDYVNDPLCSPGKVRARTGNEGLKAFRDAQTKTHLLTLPIYAQHDPADKITSANAVKRLMASSPSPDKTFVEKLYTVSYVPTDAGGITRPVVAVVQWHHGYGEHISRSKYVSLFTELANAGIAVYAYDAHGHGKSEPASDPDQACLVRNWHHLVDDCTDFAREVAAKHDAAIPRFMGGVSLGGLIATHTVLHDQAVWRGLILSSAAIDLNWNWTLRVQASIGSLLAALLPRARLVPAVPPEHISPDPDYVRDFVEDPLNYPGDVRCKTANEILKAFREAQRKEHLLTLPIYAHHGTADLVTSLPAVRRLLANCRSSDKTLDEVEGGWHEVLAGPGSEQVVARLKAWLLTHADVPEAKL
ncbi:hypothetical protein WJX72_006371 [[Myrmecia] bisecta]|uniref:Serine aminopeptidase S33 domain-containing protein n=1 Tax=[Myrmecia] bisecta TaxID=41462 RepID=A0AAW1R6Z0_9CHLO